MTGGDVGSGRWAWAALFCGGLLWSATTVLYARLGGGLLALLPVAGAALIGVSLTTLRKRIPRVRYSELGFVFGAFVALAGALALISSGDGFYWLLVGI